MITSLSNAIIKFGAALRNSYPVGTILTTKAKAGDKEFLDPNKTSYSRQEIAAVPIGERMDLPGFFGQDAADHFILPGTEIFIRKISNDNLCYTIEGKFISTFHDRDGNHKVDNIIEVSKDVIHSMFERPSIKRSMAA